MVVLRHGRAGLDVPIDLPQPRSSRNADLQRYRDQLLAVLGVTADDVG